MAPNPNGQTTPPFQFQLPPQDHHQHHQDQMDLHDFLRSAPEEVSYEDFPPPFEAYHEQNQPDDMVWVQISNDLELSILPYPPPQTPPTNFPPDHGSLEPQVYSPTTEPVVQFPLSQPRPTYQEHVRLRSFGPAACRPPTTPKFLESMPPTTPNIAPGVLVTNKWSSDLFDCFDDLELAVLTTFCPCLTFGHIAEIVDSGQTSCGTSGSIYGAILFLIGIPCLMSCSYRSKLRSRYNLVESPADDWLIHCFCECCALCQEYRELQHRGFDPSIGWVANLARDQMLQQQQQPNGILTPPANQTMMSR